MSSLLTRAGGVATIQKLLECGLDFAIGPVLSTPHAGTNWHSKWMDERYGLNDTFNVFGRGRVDATGQFRACGIVAADDPFLQRTYRESDAFEYLSQSETLTFETNTSCTFIFKHDQWVIVSETKDSERLRVDSLTGAKLTVESGFLAYGAFQEYGRFHQVTSNHGTPRSLRDCPQLLNTLKRIGRVKTLVDDTFVSGPDLSVLPNV